MEQTNTHLPKSNSGLVVRILKPVPDWAQPGVAKMRRMPLVKIVEDPLGSEHEPVDVVLHFGIYSDKLIQREGFGRLGFWFFRFAGQDIDIRAATRCATATNSPLETSLWTKLADGRTLCLYQSFGQNDAFAPWRSAARSLAKVAQFPHRVIARIHRDGELDALHVEELPSAPSSTAGFIAQALAIGRKAIQLSLYHEQWFIVVGEDNRDVLPEPSKARWQLNPPIHSFWADPFPVEQNGRVWVLLEALQFRKPRGYLAAVELLPDGRFSDTHVVMNTGSHLSYPFVFVWNGDLYMIPESGAAREVVLWKCEELPDKWTKVATLLTNVHFGDATLIEHEGLWWLFLTLGERGICLNDELSIYYAESPFGPWTPHPSNPVKSDARSARPAGNLFRRDGKLYRPAQDCSTGYGNAIVLNRIDRLDRERFSESPVGRIDPNWSRGCLRTHTLSRSENYWAIDGLRLMPRWTNLLRRIRSNFSNHSAEPI